uniref:Uncharacterized protein n=1 Tax=Aegilops tauschii subsp. strangulata TaxID=200361 RepID=A0A453E816_AEGTS
MVLVRIPYHPRKLQFSFQILHLANQTCFGCRFLLGFLCPLLWYYATTLYCCKYYNRDPRERPGLAASAIAAAIFTTAATITLSIILIIWAQK